MSSSRSGLIPFRRSDSIMKTSSSTTQVDSYLHYYVVLHLKAHLALAVNWLSQKKISAPTGLARKLAQGRSANDFTEADSLSGFDRFILFHVEKSETCAATWRNNSARRIEEAFLLREKRRKLGITTLKGFSVSIHATKKREVAITSSVCTFNSPELAIC
ncbi:hypothetical protein Gasu2_48830 [Galdieria sulphuraria]|nr:hypothetical protein Gasu2_48830 [Galdieria sulphuraria]